MAGTKLMSMNLNPGQELTFGQVRHLAKAKLVAQGKCYPTTGVQIVIGTSSGHHGRAKFYSPRWQLRKPTRRCVVKTNSFETALVARGFTVMKSAAAVIVEE
jgi:hypothetical protein